MTKKYFLNSLKKLIIFLNNKLRIKSQPLSPPDSPPHSLKGEDLSEIEQLAEEKSMLNSGDLERLSNFIKKYGHVLKEYVPSLEEETIEFYDFDGYIKQPPEYKSCNFFDLDNCTVITIDGQEEYFDKLDKS